MKTKNQIQPNKPYKKVTRLKARGKGFKRLESERIKAVGKKSEKEETQGRILIINYYQWSILFKFEVIDYQQNRVASLPRFRRSLTCRASVCHR